MGALDTRPTSQQQPLQGRLPPSRPPIQSVTAARPPAPTCVPPPLSSGCLPSSAPCLCLALHKGVGPLPPFSLAPFARIAHFAQIFACSLTGRNRKSPSFAFLHLLCLASLQPPLPDNFVATTSCSSLLPHFFQLQLFPHRKYPQNPASRAPCYRPSSSVSRFKGC